MKIKLEDLIPETPTFHLSSRKKSYTLRIPKLDDRVWIKKRFPNRDDFAQIMNGGMDWAAITEIVYHHMQEKDKREFLSTDAEKVNDQGEVEMVRISGPEHLMASIQNYQEAIAMLQAFTKAWMLSEPLIGDVVKKNLQEQIKRLDKSEKDGARNPTGARSSTRSRINTAGQKPISAKA